MDGDSRGGAALSVREVSGKPIKFVGMGEKMEALEPFYPDRLAGRILGMGAWLAESYALVNDLYRLSAGWGIYRCRPTLGVCALLLSRKATLRHAIPYARARPQFGHDCAIR